MWWQLNQAINIFLASSKDRYNWRSYFFLLYKVAKIIASLSFVFCGSLVVIIIEWNQGNNNNQMTRLTLIAFVHVILEVKRFYFKDSFFTFIVFFLFLLFCCESHKYFVRKLFLLDILSVDGVICSSKLRNFFGWLERFNKRQNFCDFLPRYIWCRRLSLLREFRVNCNQFTSFYNVSTLLNNDNKMWPSEHLHDKFSAGCL